MPSYFLLAMNEEEMLTEKIRAIITRYKARDIYDLNELLLNKVNVDFGLVNKKLQTYDKVFDQNEFEEKLEEKRGIYNEELKRLTNIFDDFETCKKRILGIFTP